ncbi:MAG: lysine--tRNA ligase [Armatimonadetes bacterium]|nr:lysine--tRNA ligase [Armatimonadota bacterium]
MAEGVDPERLRKLHELRAEGRDPFAVERFPITHHAADVLARFEALENQTVSVAGRLFQPPRLMGKAAFLDLVDATGRIQLYVRRDEIGDELFDDLKRRLDQGDIIGVTGFVFRTRTGEISVHAREFTILAKSLRPMPFGKVYETEEGEERHTGAARDPELRYRQRYVDLNVRPESRERLVNRIQVVRAMRAYLDGQGYLEVETPVLQTIAGGAAARPFLTRHNALHLDLHLRISLELYLKRLIVGGFERVYEIGRVFRNEGISTRHNPEFSLMELYAAYANLEDMMALVEGLFRHICRALHGQEHFSFQGHQISLVAPFQRLPILEGIRRNAGVAPEELTTLESAHAVLGRLGLPSEDEPTVGGIIEKLHERYTQPTLIQPTFITDFPAETSPLAKKVPGYPSLTRRFEVYMAGAELGNAFSEINDPLDQRERFTAQSVLRAGGDAEAHPMDEDYLRALEYGMPPTGGYGGGIDRLALILTDAPSIRDVILFPQLRPER